jgi:hypothetical protein
VSHKSKELQAKEASMAERKMTKIYPKMTTIQKQSGGKKESSTTKKVEKVDKNKMGLAQDREKLRQTRREPAAGKMLMPIPGTPAMTRQIKRSQMLKKRIKDRKTAMRLRKRAESRRNNRFPTHR